MNTVMMTLGVFIPCYASQLDCQLCQDLAFALRVATKMGVAKSIDEIMAYRCYMYEKGNVEERCHEVASTLEHVGRDAKKRLINEENIDKWKSEKTLCREFIKLCR
ncbi:unnamed protein product [Cylicocyclus nassatus]|uniref:Saposin B-type domain-containing protein n=1 Tax=Cylicocyclus nassatus TaxID=53992 RepID=A0AA36GTL7_CYLNA|nr:unnamed protein product [Cylicocyclus nassatus]